MDGFAFKFLWADAAKGLPQKSRLEIYESIVSLARGVEPTISDASAKAVFMLIRQDIISSIELSEKRRKAVQTRYKPCTNDVQTMYKEEREESQGSFLPPQPSSFTPTLEEKEELKEKPLKGTKESQKKKELSFVAEELLPVFTEYLSMRSKKGKSLKTRKGVETRYNHLIELAGGDMEMAVKIARQTIDNEWIDFYELRTDTQFQQYQQAPQQQQPMGVARYLYQEGEKAKELIRQMYGNDNN